jgi:7-cyano-7-deazaguanine reductase
VRASTSATCSLPVVVMIASVRILSPDEDELSFEALPMRGRSLPSLTYLGRSTPAPATPDKAVLDRVPNFHKNTVYVVRFSAPEFTTLCAVTGQPDFAHLIIDYVPKAWLIESKSLKFFLVSFRNQSSFHEQCTLDIGKKLVTVLQPIFARCGILISAGRHAD